MNKRPVSYLQIDPRWKSKPYQVKGETATIGGSGCGPTSAAMLIETLTGKTFTPVDACKWSLDHGYKALNQGTYYSYFKAQFAAFGIACERLNGDNAYGKPTHPVHDKAFKLLRGGYYLIACMGKGLWTSSGHYVVVWWENGKVCINDPASTKTERLNGDMNTFRKQVKYYWAVDAVDFNDEEGEEEMTDEQFDKFMERWLKRQDQKQPSADWQKTGVKRAMAEGISDGSRPMGIPTRAEVMIMATAAAKKE